jgi:hypothetical protein
VGSRQFWPHQTVQFLPPLFLAATLGAVGLGRALQRRQWALLVAALLLLAAGAGAERHRYASIAGRFAGRHDNVQAELGQWLAARVPAGETIYEVGEESQVYVYALRLPTSRFFASTLVTTPQARALVLADLQATRPRYVFFSTLPNPWDQALAQEIRQRFLPGRYVLVTEPRFPGFELYAREDR